jgi:PUA domain protein
MPEKHHRNFLKDKETRSLLTQASERLKTNIEQLLKAKTNIEVVETEHVKIYLLNGRPLLAKVHKELFPTLLFNDFLAIAPKAVVDMGAVPFVCKGANIMKPGIRCFEGDFAEGDFILVIDEMHRKPLALGEAVFGRAEAESATQGPVIRNVHFVGDKTWNLLKDLTS